MRNAKCKLVGLLLVFTLSGFVVLSPVNAVAPSWVGAGKYANYRGGISPAGLNVTFFVDFNWKMLATSVSGVNVTGGWSIQARVDLMGLKMSIIFSSSGWEIIDLYDSHITAPTGGDIMFGMEHIGAHTNLWVDDMTGLTLSNTSIGGRRCYEVAGSATIPIISGAIPVTKYYDTDTGVLMGLAISLDLTSMGSPAPPSYEQELSLSAWSSDGRFRVNQIPSGWELLTFPVVLNGTNVVPFAWNVGGDPILWLESVGVLLGLSALFGVVVYTRKK